MPAHSLPEFDAFAETYDAGRPQTVYVERVADLDTPVSAMLKLARGQANSFLLESVEQEDVRGRYSIVGLQPDVIWRAYGQEAQVNRLDEDGGFRPCPQPALDSLRALLDESRMELPPHLPPMAAGVFGYLSYDMARYAENINAVKPDPLGVPDGIFLRPTIVTIFDSLKNVLMLVTPARPRPGVSAAQSYAEARERLENALAAFDSPLPKSAAASGKDAPATASPPPPRSNIERQEFHAMVERAREYIFAGDIFQAVLSQRFETPFSLPPFALYRALRRVNPSPFLYFLDFGEFAVVGSSPEILVRLRGDTVTIRPIAGTRRRGASPLEDEAIGAELLRDEKERAEHLMLLDLGRNDVGRVAKPRSVRVSERFALQKTSHLIHIVSNVEGELADGEDAMSALMAGFPAGTVSGAPKIRAMQIIDELEKDKRGVYAGCIGYFSAAGDMDSCIALRTAVVKDGVMHVQAGGGIVADSSPEAEYQESVNKAAALFRAAGEAGNL